MENVKTLKALKIYIMNQIKNNRINRLLDTRQIEISKEQFPKEYKDNINYLIGFNILWK